MNRRFNLCSVEHPVPVEVVADLARQAKESNTEWVIVGAAARDLVVHTEWSASPVRATRDVDIAIAIDNRADLDAFTRPFHRLGEHKIRHLEVEVDVIPAGGLEEDGIVRFDNGHKLDVVGLVEAIRYAEAVQLTPQLTVPVAPVEIQAALKTLAWRDRHPGDPKDALDLLAILSVTSEGRYADEVWSDPTALDACDDDVTTAGAYRCGRVCAQAFSARRGLGVLAVLEDPNFRSLLVRQMRSVLAQELVDAFQRGFHSGLAR